MRLRFTDYQKIKALAKKSVEDGTFDIRRWWSNKYKKPANDPLFEKRPTAVWVREMYEDAYERKRELENALEDEDLKSEQRRELSIQYRRVCRSLGEVDPEESSDNLIAKWERELAEGKTPDLDEPVPE